MNSSKQKSQVGLWLIILLLPSFLIAQNKSPSEILGEIYSSRAYQLDLPGLLNAGISPQGTLVPDSNRNSGNQREQIKSQQRKNPKEDILKDSLFDNRDLVDPALRKLIDLLSKNPPPKPIEIAWDIIYPMICFVFVLVGYMFIIDNINNFSFDLQDFLKNRLNPLKKKKRKKNKEEVPDFRYDDEKKPWDELVASGDYEHAVHMMLLHIVEEIRVKLDPNISTAFTTREILRRVRLREGALEQVKILAFEVEVCFFGRKVCLESDYQKCQAAYKKFFEICYG